MKKILVRAEKRGYAVYCGAGALRELPRLVRGVRECSGVVVLSSTRVWGKCGRRVKGTLGGGARVILFDDAEVKKNMETVEEICRELARARADRGALVIAVGGGVVGDVAGYAAASYLRGVRFANVPTTLLAQVDSAIGGKTGVNLPEGKNLMGAFWPPEFVVADANLLKSLPEREYRAGLYEVVKAGIIGDAELFRFLERNMSAILRREERATAGMAERAVRFKARIVSGDEREDGARQLLNFGHTAGHALEAAGKYRRFLHGEAVAWGMQAETILSVMSKRLGPADMERILDLIRSVGELPDTAGVRLDAFFKSMQTDKKNRSGEVRWVLPVGIGKGRWGSRLDDALVKMFFEARLTMTQPKRSWFKKYGFVTSRERGIGYATFVKGRGAAGRG
jgi:3-dehydroquinate synthase